MNAHEQVLAPVSLEQYLDTFLAALPLPGPLEVGTFDAVGLVLSANVFSVAAVPRDAVAACDGIAIRAQDASGASIAHPAAFRVTAATNQAAETPARLGQRIQQGQLLPYGYDTVLRVSHVTAGAPHVVVTRPAAAGENVATVGSDIAYNQLLAVAGHIVTPADVALFTFAGIDRVLCIPAPRIVVIGVSPEVSGLQAPLPSGDTRAVAMMIAAYVRSLGAMVFLGEATPPTRDALAQALDANLGRSDLIVLVGGTCASTYPRAAAVLASLGSATLGSIAVESCDRQLFGQVGDCPVVAVSDLAGPAHREFELLLRPAVRHLQGRRDGARPALAANITEPVIAGANTDRYVAVRLQRVAGHWAAEPLADTAPSSRVAVAQTDGFVRVMAGSSGHLAGDTVNVELVTDYAW